MATVLLVIGIIVTVFTVIASTLSTIKIFQVRRQLQRIYSKICAVYNLVNAVTCILVSVYLYTNSWTVALCSICMWHSGKVILYSNDGYRLCTTFENNESFRACRHSNRVYALSLIPLMFFPFTSFWMWVSRWIFVGCCICYILLLSLCALRFHHGIRTILRMDRRPHVGMSMPTEICSHAICVLIRSSADDALATFDKTAEAHWPGPQEWRLLRLLAKWATLDLWVIMSLIVFLAGYIQMRERNYI